jgi:hypothetical protein
MSCKATKTDTGVSSSRPRKRQVLAMWPLCDPWYSAASPLPKCPLPGASYSAKLLCGPDTCNLTIAWFPPPLGLMELRIHRRELLTVPIDFMSLCGHSQSWNDWVDKELQDNEFISCLRRANIYNTVLLSRNSDMYRDIQGLRQFVRRWNPATHTFFLAWGEVMIMLEDIERILLLPCLRDNDPIIINLTIEETKWEDALYLGFGGREASPGGQKARLNYWI